jgi:hypothetical protein
MLAAVKLGYIAEFALAAVKYKLDEASITSDVVVT